MTQTISIAGNRLSAPWKAQKAAWIVVPVSRPLQTWEVSTIGFLPNSHCSLDIGRNMPTWSFQLPGQRPLKWWLHMLDSWANGRFTREESPVFPTVSTCGRIIARSSARRIMNLKLSESKYTAFSFDETRVFISVRRQNNIVWRLDSAASCYSNPFPSFRQSLMI